MRQYSTDLQCVLLINIKKMEEKMNGKFTKS